MKQTTVAVKADDERIPFRERFHCSVSEACLATGLSQSKIYQLMRTGRLKYTKVGDRRLVKIDSLANL